LYWIWSQDLVVLESSAGGDTVINIMTEDGFIKSTIKPSQTDPCGPLQSPLAVAVDLAHNVFVVASGHDSVRRIVMFGANGRFVREIFGPSATDRGLHGSEAGKRPAGIAAGVQGQLYAVVRGDCFAEVRVVAYA
jgi:hypothetical protein